MHSDLIAKLEALDGPDREVDGGVWCAVNGYPFVMWDGAGVVYRGKDGMGHYAENNIPKYTASLDAAVALMERVLPGWFWRAGKTSLFPKGWAYVSKTHPSHCDREDEASCADGRAENPAIALLIAALKALEARDG